jgi:hypothetical protein
MTTTTTTTASSTARHRDNARPVKVVPRIFRKGAHVARRG